MQMCQPRSEKLLCLSNQSILSYPILSYLILCLSYPILCYAMLSYPFISYHILFYHIISYPILSYSILSYPILSYPVLSHPIPSYPVLSHPILSYPIPSYPILFHPILSYPVLSYLVPLSSSSMFTPFLAVQPLGKNSKPALNADGKVWSPGIYRIAGSKFTYSIDEQGRESLRSIEPIEEPIIVTVQTYMKLM